MMSVQKDAGELLLYFYDKLVNKNAEGVETQEVINETKWEGNRLNHAYNYLKDLGLLKGISSMGNINGAEVFYVLRLRPAAINIVENQPEFKRNFGFEVNLGLLKFSWGASER